MEGFGLHGKVFSNFPVWQVVINLLEPQWLPSYRRREFPHLSKRYVLNALAFLRSYLRPEQSLLLGYGGLQFGQDFLLEALEIADSIHIGSYLRYSRIRSIVNVLKKRYNLELREDKEGI